MRKIEQIVARAQTIIHVLMCHFQDLSNHQLFAFYFRALFVFAVCFLIDFFWILACLLDLFCLESCTLSTARRLRIFTVESNKTRKIFILSSLSSPVVSPSPYQAMEVPTKNDLEFSAASKNRSHDSLWIVTTALLSNSAWRSNDFCCYIFVWNSPEKLGTLHLLAT